MNANRVLYLVAILLAASGLALRLTPVRHPEVSARSAEAERTDDRRASAPARAATQGGNAADDPIIAANIFAQSRVAPRRQSALASVPAPQRPASPRAPTLTLVGTTIGPQGAVALITTGSGTGETQLHSMGDVVAGARLVAITESTVTLLRSSGPVVLHVAPTTPQTQ